MRNSFPSFGGVMLWDASQAYGTPLIFEQLTVSILLTINILANNRYDKGIKSALVAAGGTGFDYPACSASAYVSGTNYQAGSQVSYGGYVVHTIPPMLISRLFSVQL